MVLPTTPKRGGRPGKMFFLFSLYLSLSLSLSYACGVDYIPSLVGAWGLRTRNRVSNLSLLVGCDLERVYNEVVRSRAGGPCIPDNFVCYSEAPPPPKMPVKWLVGNALPPSPDDASATAAAGTSRPSLR